jgi:hypothetical protein
LKRVNAIPLAIDRDAEALELHGQGPAVCDLIEATRSSIFRHVCLPWLDPILVDLPPPRPVRDASERKA